MGFEGRIDFWTEETEKDFYKFKSFLEEHSDLDSFQIINFLTNVYNSVSNEYGD